MNKKLLVLLLVVLIIGVMNGCGGNKYAAVAIQEEVDKCETCNMQVKDNQFAVQLTTQEGKTLKFDDIGCMNEWKQKNGTEGIGAEYVRDYHTSEWVKFEDAYYVYDASLQTPMAYGIYSFKDQNSAQEFMDSKQVGQLMSAEQLSQHTWERNKSMMKNSMDMSGHDEQKHEEMSEEGSQHTHSDKANP